MIGDGRAMSERVVIGGLQVDAALHRFIEEEAIPGTGVAAPAFWQALETLLADLTPRNRELLAKRDALQEKIDAWHKANRGQGFGAQAADQQGVDHSLQREGNHRHADRPG